MTEKQFEGFILGFLLAWLVGAILVLQCCSSSQRKQQDHRGRARNPAVHQMAEAQTHDALFVAALGMTADFAS